METSDFYYIFNRRNKMKNDINISSKMKHNYIISKTKNGMSFMLDAFIYRNNSQINKGINKKYLLKNNDFYFSNLK
jgi:hypothetical protein